MEASGLISSVDISPALSIPPDVYCVRIFNLLTLEQVWELRTVCSWFYSVCMEYFRNDVLELALNKNDFLQPTFGRTKTILTTCKRLNRLNIDFLRQQCKEVTSLQMCSEVTVLLSLLSESNCSLKSFVLRNVPHLDGFPCIAKNLLTIEELVIDHVGCTQWEGVLKNLIALNVHHSSLRSLTVNVQNYDGADLPQIATTCPNLKTLNVCLIFS